MTTDYRPFLHKVLECFDETKGVLEFALVENEPWHLLIYPAECKVDGEQWVECITVHYDSLADVFEECAEGSMTVDSGGLDIVGKFGEVEVCLHICFDPVDAKPFARRTGNGNVELVDKAAENLTLN
jgi:hypothetical protein